MIVFARAISQTDRCGIIPYVYKKSEGQMFFLLAHHSKTRELGDFGGGRKKDESALSCCLREFMEESHGIFNEEYSTINDLQDKISLTDGSKMTIIFVPVSEKWLNDAVTAFKKKRTKNDEIRDIRWVDRSTFFDLIRPRKSHSLGDKKYKMWKKVSNFLNTFPDARKLNEALKLVSEVR